MDPEITQAHLHIPTSQTQQEATRSICNPVNVDTHSGVARRQTNVCPRTVTGGDQHMWERVSPR